MSSIGKEDFVIAQTASISGSLSPSEKTIYDDFECHNSDAIHDGSLLALTWTGVHAMMAGMMAHWLPCDDLATPDQSSPARRPPRLPALQALPPLRSLHPQLGLGGRVFLALIPSQREPRTNDRATRKVGRGGLNRKSRMAVDQKHGLDPFARGFAARLPLPPGELQSNVFPASLAYSWNCHPERSEGSRWHAGICVMLRDSSLRSAVTAFGDDAVLLSKRRDFLTSGVEPLDSRERFA
jgi:hypothetical protein